MSTSGEEEKLTKQKKAVSSVLDDDDDDDDDYEEEEKDGKVEVATPKQELGFSASQRDSQEMKTSSGEGVTFHTSDELAKAQKIFVSFSIESSFTFKLPVIDFLDNSSLLERMYSKEKSTRHCL